MRHLLLTSLLMMLLAASPAAALAQENAMDAGLVDVAETLQDEAIESRLTEIQAALGGLDNVRVEVQSGVVTLNGEVADLAQAQPLIAIAERTEGVVYVQNNLTQQLAVGTRLQPLQQKLTELWDTTLRLLPLLIIALIVVMLFWFIGGLAARRSDWLQRLGVSELGAMLGRRIIRLAITAIGLIIALEILNATTIFSAVLGVAGVFGIAVGFAFRNIVENYLAGILLSARNPFRIGDLIEIGEFTGRVVRLTSRDTVLMTLDGNHLRIPNSVIITSSMTNFSLNPLRRFDFNVDITPEADLTEARQLAMRTVREMKGILSDPAPLCLIHELGASTVVLRVLGWVDQQETDVLKARSEAIRFVKQAFDQAQIEMPEPAYRLRLDSALPELPEADAPVTSRREKAVPEAASLQETDVSADDTIDKQVEKELRSSDEQNLLKK